MAELVYVDEQPSQANQVVRSAVASGQFSAEQVAIVLPDTSLEGTIDLILAHHCKVLIADYRLSEHMAGINFNGVDLVKEYQRRFDRFPCFVATSFAEEAVRESVDTNIIFPKADFLRGGGASEASDSELPFFVRVRRKLEEYESFVEATVAEFNKLAKRKEDGELTDRQAGRLIMLDGVVERLGGKNAALPSDMKGRSLSAFGDLIERAEALAERVKLELEKEES